MSYKVQISGVNTSSLERLSQKQSEELMVKIKAGDQIAKERFITCNLRLVLSVLKRFQGAKVCADDLFQAGCVGLIKAVDNFNEKLGVRFSTYAVPMIMGEIKRILRTTNSLRISRSIRDTAYKALKTRNEIEGGNCEATLDLIAQKMKLPESEVAYALDAISDPMSLYDPVYNKSGDTIELMEQIKDEKNTDERWTEKVALQSAISNLCEREQKIIYMRYYEGKTQTEISTEIGLSQAQVSRLEKNALKSIKFNIS